MKNLKDDEIELLKDLIISYDKVQLRDVTAEMLEMSLKELTEFSKKVGIPRYEVEHYTEKYTRKELADIINGYKSKKVSFASIAKILNVSEFILRKFIDEI